MRILILLFAFLSSTAHAQSTAPSLQNLNLSGALDGLAPLGLDESKNSKVQVRSAELLVYGPIDHLFDGTLNIAGHNENGQFEFQLHEGFIASSKLIPQSRFRVGKFFLGVGRLNGFHQHDWPFTTAPKVQREFLSPGTTSLFLAEGAIDTGAEYSWLVPLPFYLDVTVGVTNGACFGHCHADGAKPPYPLHYIHPTTFIDWEDGRGLLLGATYLGRKDATDTRTELWGIDATFKAREGRRLKWLWQSEVMYQTQEATDRTEKIGFYTYPQYGFDETWSFGMRFDGFAQLNMKFVSTSEYRRDFDYAFAPTLTYKASEFSSLRLSYTHEVDTTQGLSDAVDRQIMLQFTYFLGAHPAHDF